MGDDILAGRDLTTRDLSTRKRKQPNPNRQRPLSAEVLSTSEYSAPSGCHHCGAPLGLQSPNVAVSGQVVRVCSDACRTAIETIANAGLDAWYDLRTHSDAQGATTADPRHQAELDAWCVPEVEASLLRRGNDNDHRTNTEPKPAPGTTTVTLTVEGMRCAGCAWLVERLLASVPGVTTATIDFPLRRAEVQFDTHTTRLHTLLETLAKAGYRATPYTVHAEEAAIESERRARIRGLGISALFGMQVMLLSIALYASDWYGGMEAGFEQLFRWLAMMLTVPVLAWPGTDLLHRRRRGDPRSAPDDGRTGGARPLHRLRRKRVRDRHR